MLNFPVSLFPSPCFVVDDVKLLANAEILDLVQHRTSAKILLALKGYAMWDTFPLLSRARGAGVLAGCCASSVHEARLAYEEFGGEVHAFAAGYSEADIVELGELCQHIVFNSFSQWQRFKGLIPKQVKCGLRINPEHSEGAVGIYNPCSEGSRLGIRYRDFKPDELEGITGLHLHTLCQQGAEALERTLAAFELNFAQYLPQMQWLNLGGGHHITIDDYNLDLLCECIKRLSNQYGLQIYLEPGEAVALDAGYLVCTVLDTLQADMPIAILDTSACAHMPDVLEMPYRPEVLGPDLQLAEGVEAKGYTYRLGGKSCLAGDIIGEYTFKQPLKVGDRLVFLDMAIYSMVKTNTFNGLQLPDLARYNSRTGEIKLVKSFGYADFKERLS